ncbi:hypothetical protein PGB90_000361 [Kerria lacca]
MSQRGVITGAAIYDDHRTQLFMCNLYKDSEDAGDESPTFNSVSVGTLNMNTFSSLQEGELPNQVSAPFEVPHFPIEQIENKLLMQRQLNSKIDRYYGQQLRAKIEKSSSHRQEFIAGICGRDILQFDK